MNAKVTVTYDQNVNRKLNRAWKISVADTDEPLRDLSQQGDVWNGIEILVGVYATRDAAFEAARKYRSE